MTNSLSLILIAAVLVLLAGGMLYARWALRRARVPSQALPGTGGAIFAEDSDAIGDGMSGAAEILAREDGEGPGAGLAAEEEADGGVPTGDISDGTELPAESGESQETRHFHHSLVSGPEETPRKSTVKIRLDAVPGRGGGEVAAAEVRVQGTAQTARQEGYLDDLQEAAVGLAELMNSPASRRVPELLAEEAQRKAGEAAVVGEQAAEKAAQVEETEEEESGPVAEEELPQDREEPEAVQLDLFELLGEEVHGRIEEIDSGLDALEELLSGIEASLAEFSSFGEADEDPAAEGESGKVAEAA